MFLPLVCLTYLLVRPELKNHILLVASIIFYAWGEPAYLAIMFVSILINFFGAILVEKYHKYAKFIMFFAIIANLTFLFYFKYFNFVVENINLVFHSHIDFIKVVMPIGISFYTFQAMSYLIDVYRGQATVQHNFYKLALYISLFPQLVAGPIVKYKDVADQIDNRVNDFDHVLYGIKRFIIGLSKKMLLANTIGVVADKIFEQPVVQYDCLTTWLGLMTYALQIFYDFSGYSDMAIGLGAIFGFKFLENFTYPYISKSVSEFWTRWHISLSTWFKEYVYFSLGGSRCSPVRAMFNLFITFVATGAWHGATWNFVLWGVWNAIFVIAEHAIGFPKMKGGFLFTTFQHIYAIFIIWSGIVFFRADSVGYSIDFFKNMFGLISEHQISYTLSYYLTSTEIIAIIIGIICGFPIFKNMLKIENKIGRCLVNAWLICLFIISVSTIAASTYNPFIYFRF